jgi:hypothetical protein
MIRNNKREVAAQKFCNYISRKTSLAATTPRQPGGGLCGETWSSSLGLPKFVLTRHMNLVPHIDFLYNICQLTLIRFHTAGATSD